MVSNQFSQRYFWQETSALALALTILWSILLWPPAAEDGSLFLPSILAGTGGILLALSFSLSSFAYYFNFLDAQVVYRKYLGLMGYFFSLGYVGVEVSAHPQKYLAAFPTNLATLEVGLGFLAMSIFTLMALVSNQRATRLLGGRLWKNILGLGYLAYATLVIRAIWLDTLSWELVLGGNFSEMTVRMFLTVLGIAVLLFRVSVPFHQKYVRIQ